MNDGELPTGLEVVPLETALQEVAAIERKKTQAREAARAASPQNTATSSPEPQRPAIRVMPGDLADATAAALRVLASERDPLAAVYVRGNLLMRPIRVRERLNAGSLQRPLDALILRPVDVDWLRLRLAQRADFYVMVKKEMKAAPTCRSAFADARSPRRHGTACRR